MHPEIVAIGSNGLILPMQSMTGSTPDGPVVTDPGTGYLSRTGYTYQITGGPTISRRGMLPDPVKSANPIWSSWGHDDAWFPRPLCDTASGIVSYAGFGQWECRVIWSMDDGATWGVEEIPWSPEQVSGLGADSFCFLPGGKVLILRNRVGVGATDNQSVMMFDPTCPA